VALACYRTFMSWSVRRWLLRARPAGMPSVTSGVRSRPALVDLAMRTFETEHFDRFVARVPISRVRAGR
jgi:hypothetical protein